MKNRKNWLFLVLLFILFLTCAGCWLTTEEKIALKKKMQEEYGQTLLHHAVMINDLDEVRSILNDGVININAATKEKGSTALHLAALFDHTEIYELLLEKGADTKIKDNNGDTAPYLARRIKEIKEIAPP